MPHASALLFAMVVAFGGTILCAHGGTIRHDRQDAAYLRYAARFPSVGKIHASLAGGGALTASGVLIAPDLVATAAHATEGARSLEFRLPELGVTYSGTGVVIHPNWTGDVLEGYDLSVFRLDRPVAEVLPASRFVGGWEAFRPAAIAGYGISGDGISGFTGAASTVRRAGMNHLDSRLHGRILQSDYDAPHYQPTGAFLGSPTPLELEYAIAPGDSGGGLFVWADRRWQLVGIHSFIMSYDSSPNASYGDLSGFTRLRYYEDWLAHVERGRIAMTPLGSHAEGVAAAPSAMVPEPASVVAMLAGLLAAARRRPGNDEAPHTHAGLQS